MGYDLQGILKHFGRRVDVHLAEGTDSTNDMVLSWRKAASAPLNIQDYRLIVSGPSSTAQRFISKRHLKRYPNHSPVYEGWGNDSCLSDNGLIYFVLVRVFEEYG